MVQAPSFLTPALQLVRRLRSRSVAVMVNSPSAASKRKLDRMGMVVLRSTTPWVAVSSFNRSALLTVISMAVPFNGGSLPHDSPKNPSLAITCTYNRVRAEDGCGKLCLSSKRLCVLKTLPLYHSQTARARTKYMFQHLSVLFSVPQVEISPILCVSKNSAVVGCANRRDALDCS